MDFSELILSLEIAGRLNGVLFEQEVGRTFVSGPKLA